jgi:hypothetical protein
MKTRLDPYSFIRYAFGGAPERGRDWTLGTSSSYMPPVPPSYGTSMPGVTTEAIDRAIRNINEFAKLPENWDGYGALKISPEAIAGARGIVSSAYGFPMSDVTPTANGTLGIEWQRNDKEAYVEVGRTRVSGYLKPSSIQTYYVACNTPDAAMALPAVIQSILTSDHNVTAPITPVTYDRAVGADD